ncbi:MAG: hypothetical protein DRJ42_28090 [Deltaproteobacteria bacterium]|nr:MAG: hypothetical protein DRJ42_28090 [Deltaproteobacteria bacterium]
MRIVASSGLSQAQIDTIVEEAEQYRRSDEMRKELAEIRNSAEALLYTSEKAVEECVDLVAADIIDGVQVDIDSLRLLIESGGDAISLKEALQSLELSAYRIAESMYGGMEDLAEETPEEPVADGGEE